MSELAVFCKKLAESGAEVIRSFGGSFTTEKKGKVNLVTEADLASEKKIVSLIKSTYPEHSIMAEEDHDDSEMLNAEHCWVIDPLDGTTNFAAGIPQVGVSVALVVRGQVLHAAVSDVFRKETYYATRGEGAYCGETKLSVSNPEQLIDCVVATGFPYDRIENWDLYNRYFSNVCNKSRDLRRFGAAALDLAWVAAGKFDGFFECGLKPWDVAAGSLLITEAGGRVGSFQAEFSLISETIVASGPEVFNELCDTING